jgi:tetratricopeptide (TPR) repeat protein
MVEKWMNGAFVVWVSGSLLALAAACNRSEPRRQTIDVPASCLVALTADAHGDSDILRLQQEAQKPQSRSRAIEQLGYRFVARARLSNDPGNYKVAEQAASCLESSQPDDAAALLLRGHVLHQLHQFKDAEALARRLVTRREFVLDYGLLGDALMEQGRLSEAAAAYQKMIDLKPFYQSYTRAAHLRWLKGDLSGAIELMRSAVSAASPRDRESIAWAYTRLAHYELQRGQTSVAFRLLDAAQSSVPEYAAALLTRGRILLAERRFPGATDILRRAARLNPLPEYQWTLADAFRAAGNSDDATAVETALVRDGASTDPRTLSLFLSTRHREGARALDLARREIDIRSDVFTLDTVAWALASMGRLTEASNFMRRALAEGTRDGRLFVHAALIARANGRLREAVRWAQDARAHRFTLLPSELDALRAAGLIHPNTTARGN